MNSLSSSTAPSKVNKTYNKDPADFITINEKVNLTKDQHEVLNIICDINDRHRIYQEQETPIDQLFKRTTGISVSRQI